MSDTPLGILQGHFTLYGTAFFQDEAMWFFWTPTQAPRTLTTSDFGLPCIDH